MSALTIVKAFGYLFEILVLGGVLGIVAILEIKFLRGLWRHLKIDVVEKDV